MFPPPNESRNGNRDWGIKLVPWWQMYAYVCGGGVGGGGGGGSLPRIASHMAIHGR